MDRSGLQGKLHRYPGRMYYKTTGRAMVDGNEQQNEGWVVTFGLDRLLYCHICKIKRRVKIELRIQNVVSWKWAAIVCPRAVLIFFWRCCSTKKAWMLHDSDRGKSSICGLFRISRVFPLPTVVEMTLISTSLMTRVMNFPLYVFVVSGVYKTTFSVERLSQIVVPPLLHAKLCATQNFVCRFNIQQHLWASLSVQAVGLVSSAEIRYFCC